MVSVLVHVTVAVTEPTSSSVVKQRSSNAVEKGRELAYHSGLVPIRGPRKKKLGDGLGVGTSSNKEQTKIGMMRGGGGAKGRLYYTRPYYPNTRFHDSKSGKSSYYYECLDPPEDKNVEPTISPTQSPFGKINGDDEPTISPTVSPTLSPSEGNPSPESEPTTSPTLSPELEPTQSPTLSPELIPTQSPTLSPEGNPPEELEPTQSPTTSPTLSPEVNPTKSPSLSPTINPTLSPESSPTTTKPTKSPNNSIPLTNPTLSPSLSPTLTPTLSPVVPKQERIGIDGGRNEELNTNKATELTTTDDDIVFVWKQDTKKNETENNIKNETANNRRLYTSYGEGTAEERRLSHNWEYWGDTADNSSMNGKTDKTITKGGKTSKATKSSKRCVYYLRNRRRSPPQPAQRDDGNIG